MCVVDNSGLAVHLNKQQSQLYLSLNAALSSEHLTSIGHGKEGGGGRGGGGGGGGRGLEDTLLVAAQCHVRLALHGRRRVEMVGPGRRMRQGGREGLRVCYQFSVAAASKETTWSRDCGRGQQAEGISIATIIEGIPSWRVGE